MSVKGLLLLNLGSPSAPDTASVRRYLNEFLTDPYVIDIPAVWRYPLVYGLITPRRASTSAHAYQSVWRPEGSPLTYFTRTFAEGLAAQVKDQWSVRWAMRYGDWKCKEVLRNWQVDELYVVPLYPQFAESSTQTALDEARRAIHDLKTAKKVFYLQDFYDQSEFIEAQSQQIEREVHSFKPDRLLLSFHGLPEHHVSKLHPRHCIQSATCCDSLGAHNRLCYRAQAMATARALEARSSLAKDQIQVSFQSRLGRRPWIKPYTDHVVTEMAARGVQRLLVSCPSFVADCLETLEEVQIRLAAQFLSEGGKALRMVPALNAESHWIEKFAHMINNPALQWQPL